MALSSAERREAIGATICVGTPGPTQILPSFAKASAGQVGNLVLRSFSEVGEHSGNGQGRPFPLGKDTMTRIFVKNSG